jgi:hypothetical protein
MRLRLVLVAAAAVGVTACGGGDAVVFTTSEAPAVATTTTAAPVSTTSTVGAVTSTAETTTSAAPPLTLAELAALLHDPASAYVASRGGPIESAALSAAVLDVLDSPRASDLDAIITTGGLPLRAMLQLVADSPGFGWLKSLEQEGALTGLPVFLLDGSYAVGADIQPGRYEALGVGGCYWETLDAAGGKSSENFVGGGGRAEATIRAADAVFNSTGCGTWFGLGP